MSAQSAPAQELRRLDQHELDAVCAKHDRLWTSKPGGARAAFAWKDLSGLDLRGKNLCDADLTRAVLADWAAHVPRFVKVMPKDYKRMLACLDRARAQGLTGDEAVMAAFEENARDLSRVGGN